MRIWGYSIGSCQVGETKDGIQFLTIHRHVVENSGHLTSDTGHKTGLRSLSREVTLARHKFV